MCIFEETCNSFHSSAIIADETDNDDDGDGEQTDEKNCDVCQQASTKQWHSCNDHAE